MNAFHFLFDNGDLRKIKLKGQEIIQRIYYAVRDEAWLNVSYTLINYVSRNEQGKEAVSFDLLFKRDRIEFNTHVKIETNANFISIETKGEACSDFNKNRIGLCIHLSASLKGTVCEVVHSDKTKTTSSLPVLISPHQPFKDIVGISWMQGNNRIDVSFEGDIYEMEDQRNWTDASYKIYSTPLELPFPVHVKKGDIFYQKITITTNNTEISSEKTAEKEDEIKVFQCPYFGILDTNNFNELYQENTLFSFIRLDVRLYKKSWKEDLSPIIEKSCNLKLALYCVLYFSKNYSSEIADFLRFIEQEKLTEKVHSIALLSNERFVLSDSALKKISQVLRPNLEKVRIGGGTDANFAQLNRNRPKTEFLDFIFYSIQPQEHASDRLSLCENIMGQYDTANTAKSFSDGKDIDISALSFYRRFNANIDFFAKGDSVVTYENKGSNFEAGWLIGSMYQLIVAGIKTINFVCSLERNSPLMNLFDYMSTNLPESFYSEGSFSPEEYSYLSWKSKNLKHSVMANLTPMPLKIFHQKTEYDLEPYEIIYKETELPV